MNSYFPSLKKKNFDPTKFKQRLGFVLDGVSNGGNSCYIKVCHWGSMSLKPNLIYEINSSPFLFLFFQALCFGFEFIQIFFFHSFELLFINSSAFICGFQFLFCIFCLKAQSNQYTFERQSSTTYHLLHYDKPFSEEKKAFQKTNVNAIIFFLVYGLCVSFECWILIAFLACKMFLLKIIMLIWHLLIQLFMTMGI
jgi:hypothetical protein